MPARGTIRSLVALGILAAFATSVGAGDGPGATNGRMTTALQQEQRLTASECRRLVYPGKPPFKGAYVFPEDLDERAVRTKQRKIKAAYDKLSDNVQVSLPALGKYADDGRFSYVYEDVGTSGVVTRASVGFACRRIIEAHVEVYRREVTRADFASIPRCPSFIDACGGIDRWWRSRKDKTLAELQLEGIEWALRLRKPKLFKSRKEWATAKKALQKMADGIRASKKPILVEHHVYFFGK